MVRKKEGIKKNYLYNLIYEVVALLIPLITTPYLSRVLGAENIGIFSYTYSIVTYFVLFGSLGVSTYARREIAYVSDNDKKMNTKFWEILLLRTVTLSISMFVFYFTFCTNVKYGLYYKILLLEMLGSLFDISWFYQGIEDFKKVVVRNSIIKIILALLIFIIVKNKNDLWKYIIIYSISTLIGNLSLWTKVKKYISLPNEKLNIKQHIKPAIMLLLPQIAVQVYTILDKVMLGYIIIDKAEVGYYEQASKIVRLCLTLVTTISVVISTRIANMYSKGNSKYIIDKIYQSFKFVWFLGTPLMFGLIFVSDNFVPWFYGNEFASVSNLIKIFSPILLIVGFANVAGNQYLIATSKQNKYTFAVTISAIINFILNLYLINKYLSLGATIASVVSELVGLIIQFLFIRETFKLKRILISGLKYILSATLMSVGLFLSARYLYPSLTNTVILTCIGGVIYVISLILLKDEFILEILKIIRKPLKLMREKLFQSKIKN